MPISGGVSGGGALVLLSSTIFAGNASVDISGLTYYKRYIVQVSGEASGNTSLSMIFNNDTGNNYSHQSVVSAATVLSSSLTSNAAALTICPTFQAGAGNSLTVIINNDLAGKTKGVTFFGGAWDHTINGNGYWSNTAAVIDRIKITPSAGNLATGIMNIYGVSC